VELSFHTCHGSTAAQQDSSTEQMGNWAGSKRTALLMGERRSTCMATLYSSSKGSYMGQKKSNNSDNSDSTKRRVRNHNN
jgi:hypothetical protein